MVIIGPGAIVLTAIACTAADEDFLAQGAANVMKSPELPFDGSIGMARLT